MYGVVTTINFHSGNSQRAAHQEISKLVDQARELDGFVEARIMQSGSTESILITTYKDELAADRVGKSVRSLLSSAIGPLVTGPPDRRSGTVVFSSETGTR